MSHTSKAKRGILVAIGLRATTVVCVRERLKLKAGQKARSDSAVGHGSGNLRIARFAFKSTFICVAS